MTDTGAVGEMPVRVLPNQQAKFLDLDFLEAVQEDQIRYEQAVETQIAPGDVCIFTASISDVNTKTEPTIITVEVLDVGFIQQAGENRTEIDEMMEHLDEARQRRQEQRVNETCANCASIESDTRLSVERKQGGRDLHYCAQCGRLLSTEEYQEWIEIHD
ncbi:hypothetical protein [Haloarcula sp. 1CSR25-25]|uniref:hypothetical protein n=1 Tax=Haloarcula sp. 1CSR25-25 TaxID=2862545 RepID=UPI002893FB57|nr:hypothetical protein [Haloarcula sp. 1CSR25-25]MDT3436722.1 hypothetical protein [Haloarcula sp. 1CSR25-25]